MKIKAKVESLYGKKALLNNIYIDFDSDGFADLNDKDKSILDSHADFVEIADSDSLDLKEMSIGDLRDLCKASGWDASEWESLKKPALIDYLTAKMK